MITRLTIKEKNQENGEVVLETTLEIVDEHGDPVTDDTIATPSVLSAFIFIRLLETGEIANFMHLLPEDNNAPKD